MMRNRTPLSILQKTYDECYLTCSTAVYYEGQNNEAEAMRCWRTALDQIYDHHANKIPRDHVARTETEKALTESLRQLELQCKERIDLLQALRLSRSEDATLRGSSSSGADALHFAESPHQDGQDKGWIGGGTIPAITYTELSRPALRPALPPRPSLQNRTSSEQAVIGARNRRSSLDLDPPHHSPNTRLPLLPPPKPETSRSPSPERHTMRTTLRSHKPKDRTSKATPAKQPSTPADGPGASKAATLAWTSLISRDRASKATASGHTTPTASRHPEDIQRSLLRTPSQSSMHWDSHSRRLIAQRNASTSGPSDDKQGLEPRNSDEYNDYDYPRPSPLSVSAASSALSSLNLRSSNDRSTPDGGPILRQRTAPPPGPSVRPPMANSGQPHPHSDLDSDSCHRRTSSSGLIPRRKPLEVNRAAERGDRTPSRRSRATEVAEAGSTTRSNQKPKISSSSSADEDTPRTRHSTPRKRRKDRGQGDGPSGQGEMDSSLDASENEDTKISDAWRKRKAKILKNLPPAVDEHAAKQILNEIVVQGDEVHWSDVAGLQIAKNALRETVVYPFLRPDLFMGLREPARGMLLFGPPGTGKTMLARAVATESKSTFFSISASSLTSKYLGESEKLVRALFGLAKVLAPSIIFVDEIDSLLSHRSGSGEHEATRRIKTEFLIQWSDLQRAAAGRENGEKDKDRGDANRVLVLAATNLPWAIDEAARRRFVRRQYIPLPEPETRATQLRTLLGQQKHTLSDEDIDELVALTDGFSGSDITALAKDAAMGPLRSLGEALLHMTMDQIRPIELSDFVSSLTTIRPSVSKAGLEEYEKWAREFGERGG